jgi:nitroimidazol reductase NimA-like FMN-containing flavoprotein (pyridoxamine 5'-phosphate oxidase superfamily)
MSLAVICGHCYKALWGQIGDNTPIPEENTLLIGVRDLSPDAERARLQHSRLRYIKWSKSTHRKTMKLTARTELRRRPNRGSHDTETIYAILDEAFVAHVGFNVDGQPFVIPTLFGREDEKLYLYGSAASRMLRHLELGLPACVNVIIVDGLVLARSAFHHSINYTSVVAFGIARKIDEPTPKTWALRVISEHVIAGRWQEVRPPTKKELNATTVLEFCIEEASAKTRTGPPMDDEGDYSLEVWAGILPLQLERKAPVPDPRLASVADAPEYVLHYRRPSQPRGS